MRTLGQAEQPLPHFVSGRVLCAYLIKRKESPQHGEELRRLPKLLTQFICLAVDLARLRAGKSLALYYSRAERNKQGEFLLDAGGGIRQSFEELKSRSQVRNRLLIPVPPERIFSSFVMILYGSFDIAPQLKVCRKCCRDLGRVSLISRF